MDDRQNMRIMMVDPSCFSLPYDHCLCEALVGQGCKVTLARGRFLHTSWNQQPSYTLWEQFYRFTHSRTQWRGKKLLWNGSKSLEHMLDMGRFTSMVKESRPDIVHFQWLSLPILDGFYLRQLRRITAVVLTLHNTTAFHGAPSSRLQALGFASALRLVDAIIVHTAYSRQRVLDKQWVPADRINVIPHGVLDYYRTLPLPAPRESAPDARDMTVLFFGVLKPYKGVDTLIRAFAQLRRDILRRSRLVIAGNPRMNLAPLRDLVQGSGIASRVVWKLGFLPEEEVRAQFENATVVVLPYRECDQSGVLMTAVGFGKPVIATRVGGIPETLIDGVHGYLVEPDRVEALTTSIERVLSCPEMAQSMGKAVAQLGAHELSWESVARETITLYQRLAR